MTLREELTEYDPPGRMAYELLSGLPLGDYRAEVDVTAADGGSEVRWRAEFDGLPGVGGLYRRQLQKAFEDITERAARAGEER